MRIVLAFDSFKGSLSSAKAGEAAARAIRSVMPEAECDIISIADGGEGTVEAALKATGGEYVSLFVSGPLGEKSETTAGLLPGPDASGATAVLETASICGLVMMPPDRLNPELTSSRGVGEAILQLLDKGIRRFVIGLGGSATNDGGMGMLAALGAIFLDENGELLYGSGGELEYVAQIDLAGLDSRLAACSIAIASDVDNPLVGPLGATMTFGRQKGASPQQQERLDQAMSSFGGMVEAVAGGCWMNEKGAGAAGGIGFALLVIGGHVVSGAEWLMSAVQLKSRLQGAAWVVTGEGRSDGSTLHGKLPFRVAEAANEAGVRCLLLSGSLGEELGELEERFSGGCFAIVKEPSSLEHSMRDAEHLLERAARQLFRLIAADYRS